MDAIFQTESSFALLVLRLGVAITFFAHGSQKVLGWFGGRGPTDVLNNWDEKYGYPVALGMVGILNTAYSARANLIRSGVHSVDPGNYRLD
jgi:putative oxidoreductase